MAHPITRNEPSGSRNEASSTSGSQLMNQIEALEAAKRRAASSYTRMATMPPSQQNTTQVTRDEQEVLCARVDVLNALLRQTSETPLCLEATGRKGPRVCATYDRLRCEGELELGPMQSTMAWAVRDAEDAVLHLMSTQDSHPPADAVKALLDLVRQSAPKKDILQGLHAALSMPGPERLVLKSLQGVNSLETDGHTRVYEGLGEADGPTPPLYRVLWGALSLDVLEGWQNPSTNAAIRLSILHAAHQAAREAQQTKAPQWSNVAYLQVRIYHGNECHRLSLRPFWDSESCTVSHIQFKQSVFDDSGPERGLLNLGSDPNSIHPIPMGKILPLEAYVCLGAHRKSRLSEAQLNYVHAQGLLAHGFDSKLLPDSARLLQVQPGRMPPAKATRVSGDKLDVMASSYHLADQVYTTISVVQYPPFGTQFGTKPATEKSLVSMPAPTRMVKSSTGKPGMRKTSAQKRTVAVKKEGEEEVIVYDSDGEPVVVDQDGDWYDTEQNIEDKANQAENNWDSGTRVPFEPTADNPDQNLLYLEERRRHDGPFIDKRGRRIKQWFEGSLQEGQFYFIDGVHGDPYDIRDRIIMFDCAPTSPRFHILEKHAKTICSGLRTTHGKVWDPNLSFYDNIYINHATVFVDHGKQYESATIGQEWSYRWSKVILDEINNNQSLYWVHDEVDPDDHQDFRRKGQAGIFLSSYDRSKNFWYCSNNDVWISVLKGSNVNIPDYIRFSRERVEEAKASGEISHDLQAQLGLTSPGKNPLQSSQIIPLPKTRLSARSDPAVSQLQSRIAALESKLGQAKQDENTQFLLARVLDKLDAIEEV